MQKSKAKGRAKGTGAVVKVDGKFYLRDMVAGPDGRKRRHHILLRNEDGTYCTRREQADEAADRLNRMGAPSDITTEEKRLEAIGAIRRMKAQATFRMEDIWDAFLSNPNRPQSSPRHLAEQKRELDRFIAWLKANGIDSPAQITPDLTGKYMVQIGQDISNRCFNVYLGFLRLIFRLTYKSAGMNDNPFADIMRRPLESESRKDFTLEQINAIFRGFDTGFFYEDKSTPGLMREFKPLFPQEMRMLLMLCAFTGADGQTSALMKWENVDDTADTISYVRNKTRHSTGGRITTLPIHPVLKNALETAKQWKKENSPYILPNVAERFLHNHWGVQKDVQRIIRCALGVEVTGHESAGKRKLGVSLYSLHSFRHSFVSLCVNSGVPLEIVAEIVGHGSPAMTRHYSHIHDEAKRKAIAALPQLDMECQPDSLEAIRAEITARLRTADESTLKKVLDILK